MEKRLKKIVKGEAASIKLLEKQQAELERVSLGKFKNFADFVFKTSTGFVPVVNSYGKLADYIKYAN